MSAPAGEDRRKAKHQEGGENEERWLLPYADMITLLLALFIMLYAASSVNNSKLDKLSKSVQRAFNGQKATPGENQSDKSTPIPKDSPANKLLQAGVTLQQLQKATKAVQDQQAEDARLRKLKVKVENYAKKRGLSSALNAQITERGLVIRLVSDKVLFDVGQARIRNEVRGLLNDISHVLGPEKNNIRVEGHTDSSPISTPLFASNWELSAVRATSVVRLMIEDGLQASRLAAAGYADRRPRSGNSSETGRQRNRRVEIVVLRSGINPLTPDAG